MRGKTSGTVMLLVALAVFMLFEWFPQAQATCTSSGYQWRVTGGSGDPIFGYTSTYGTYGSIYTYNPGVNKMFSSSSMAELFPNGDFLELGWVKELSPWCTQGLFYFAAWNLNGVYGENDFSTGTVGTTHTVEIAEYCSPPCSTYRAYFDGVQRKSNTYSYTIGYSVAQGESWWPTGSGITNQIRAHFWSLKWHRYAPGSGLYYWNDWGSLWIAHQDSPYWSSVVSSNNFYVCGPDACP